jgi:hypothetical protein
MHIKFKIIYLLPVFLFFTSCSYTFYQAKCAYPIPGSIQKIAVLPDSLYETSGLAKRRDTFLSFNDSGGKPALYSFKKGGPILQQTIIENASNTDWEDIAYDGLYYYIADVGNNFGTRDTLVVYKVNAGELAGADIFHSGEQITFSYEEEVNRTERGWYSHDCEALFYFNDSLYLFAKDWVTMDTRIYVMPAKAGHYNLSSRVVYSVNALITGADINPVNNEVVLVGYKKTTMPVLIKYQYANDPAIIKCGGKARKYPRLLGTQFEGVCYDEDGRIVLSSEKRIYKQALYQSY